MNISVEKVTSSERTNLEKLLQLYLHDLSLYFPITFDSKVCEYEYDLNRKKIVVLFRNGPVIEDENSFCRTHYFKVY